MGGACCCENDTKQQVHSSLGSEDEDEYFGNTTPLLTRLARQQREQEEHERAINYLENNGEDSAPPMYLSRATSSSVDNDPLSPYFDETEGGGGGGGAGEWGGWGQGSMGNDPRMGFYSSSLPSSLTGSFCGPSPSRWGGGGSREGGGKRRKVKGVEGGGVLSSSMTSSSVRSENFPKKLSRRSMSSTNISRTSLTSSTSSSFPLSPSPFSAPTTPLIFEWEQKYLPPKSHFSARKLLLGQYQILKVFGVREEGGEGWGDEGGEEGEREEEGRGRGLYLVGVKDKKEREGEGEGEGERGEEESINLSNDFPVFVAKLVEKDEGIGKITPSRLLSIMSDLAQIQGVEHENLLTLCNSRCYKDSLYLFYEYFPESESILSFFEKNELTMDFLISSSIQILNGLEFLHSLKICHRAIICRNILIHPSGHVKLAYSQLTPPIFVRTKNIPNIHWMSPEVAYKEHKFMAPSDVWSFGCCILELLLSTSIFTSLWGEGGVGKGGKGGKERGNLFRGWVEGGRVVERIEERRLGLWGKELRMFLDVLGGCFEIDVNERITIPELRKHLEKLQKHVVAQKQKK